MAEIEDTPPATEPLPTLPGTRPLPPQPTPATLPDPADLRPAGPSRRWTWLLGGVTAGAGAAALVLGLVANLVTPAATAGTTAATSVSPATTVSATTTVSPAPTLSLSPAPTLSVTPAASGPASPTTAPYTTLPAGCALVRPETVDRYAKGTSCSEQKDVGGMTNASAGWHSNDGGWTMMQVMVQLSPIADYLYETTVAAHRTGGATTGMKVTDDRAVPGIGEKATLLYTTMNGNGHADLVALQRNALITISYEKGTFSGVTLKDIPPADAEAAATAWAQDVVATLAAS
ncbi:hypothetical protein AB0C76_15325 [Kitasatospora sp. NPDC048722]|uniref:hypothetical protein n=1 Tax=Kitasatospora sp. NPDC048722 TaxID=3155639 RepID=UPI0033F949E4